MISARIGPITGIAISPVVCKDEDKVCSTNTPKTVLAPVIITLAAAITNHSLSYQSDYVFRCCKKHINYCSNY